MNVNKKIKAHRQELGLTDVVVAKQVGLSIHEYGDIEQHDHEVYDVAHLRAVKKICEVLKVDFLELFDMKCAFCEEGNEYLADYTLPRNELIRKRRTEMGISQEELGDRVGFYEVEVQNLEGKPDHLETWVIENIKELSTVINVPLQVLLNVKCKKCGR